RALLAHALAGAASAAADPVLHWDMSFPKVSAKISPEFTPESPRKLPLESPPETSPWNLLGLCVCPLTAHAGKSLGRLKRNCCKLSASRPNRGAAGQAIGAATLQGLPPWSRLAC